MYSFVVSRSLLPLVLSLMLLLLTAALVTARFLSKRPRAVSLDNDPSRFDRDIYLAESVTFDNTTLGEFKKWVPHLSKFKNIDVGISQENFLPVFTKLHEISVRDNKGFPKLTVVTETFTRFDSLTDIQKHFVLNVADKISQLTLSDVQLVEDKAVAIKLLSKCEEILLDVPQTEEIKELLKDANPKYVELQYQTDLDLSKYSNLETVSLTTVDSLKSLPAISSLPNVSNMYVSVMDRDERATGWVEYGSMLERFLVDGWEQRVESDDSSDPIKGYYEDDYEDEELWYANIKEDWNEKPTSYGPYSLEDDFLDGTLALTRRNIVK
jgi:hypothetical protein